MPESPTTTLLFKPCLIIPHYNHSPALTEVLAKLAQALQTSPLMEPIPSCFIVDDGSTPEHRQQLELLAAQYPFVTLIVNQDNQGKGMATVTGFKAAIKAGYSHALQIDADGQHDVGDVATFIRASQQHPEHIIAGVPVYDDSVPAARKYGRYLTRFWVWVNTLSFAIGDAQCGFRMYPLPAVSQLLEHHNVARHMDFDIDIIVRLYWQGCPVLDQPTRVIYPDDGVSHFDMLKDNVRISRCHTLLFFGMLIRLPRLLWRRWSR